MIEANSLWKQENTGLKQDSKNQLRLVVPVGHEPFGFIDGSVLIMTQSRQIKIRPEKYH
jgi:hypothetical protein